MTRPTLKLPRKVEKTSAPPKAMTTRARDVLQAKGRSKAAPPPAVAAPAPKPAPKSKPGQTRFPAEQKAAKPKPAQPGFPAAQKTAKSKPEQTRAQSQARSDLSPRVAPAAAPRPPRPEPSQPDEPRLSKRMSELGLCSRREADEWIENKWVKVDGKVVDQLGARVSREARIEVDPAASRHQSEQVTILLNKPVGYVSGQPEHGYQPAIVLIKPENHWAEDPSPQKFRPSHLRNLATAGRLDIDSTGLLVFTQDGRVARRLIGEDSDVEKEYLVRVEGTLTDEGLALLRHGLELDGVKLKPAKVSWSNEDQLRFVLREGRKRQIRRMCELVGLNVTGLKRVRSGGVPLGSLPVGQWRYLRRDERF